MTKARRLTSWFISIAFVLGIPVWSQVNNAMAVSGGPVLTPYGTPAVNAPVRVCAVTAIGTPCSTSGVTLYSDANLTHSIPNPTSTNSSGVFAFWTTAGFYLVQVQATPTVTYTYYASQSAGTGAGSYVTVNGSSPFLPTANFNDTTPSAEANGLNIKWQFNGSNISANLVGDGVSTDFLNGTGVFSPVPSPITLQHNSSSTGILQNLYNLCDNGSCGPALDAGMQQVVAKTGTNDGSWVLETPSSNLSPYSSPPIPGQYIIVYPASNTLVGCSSADDKSGSVLYGAYAGSPCNNPASVTWNFNTSTFPAGLSIGNVTAVYPFVISSSQNQIGNATGNNFTTACSGTGVTLNNGQPDLGAGTNISYPLQQYTSSASLVVSQANFNAMTCEISAAMIDSGVGQPRTINGNATLVGAYVYYTGTRVTQPSQVYVQIPLKYNSFNSTLSLPLPYDASVDFGTVNQYSITNNAFTQIAGGIKVSFCAQHASTSATPTLNVNGWGNWTIVGPTGGSLSSGDIADCPTTGAETQVILGVNSKWFLQNPQVSGGGSGTVTSVGMTVPSWLTVAGSPVSSSGTLAVTAAAGQTQNEVLASPNGSAGAVALRALVNGDLPTSGVTAGSYTNSNLTINAQGIITAASNGSAGSGLPSCTSGQMVYYASSGSTGTCLSVGTNLSITTGTLNASGGSGLLPGYGSLVNQTNFSSVTQWTANNLTTPSCSSGGCNFSTGTAGFTSSYDWVGSSGTYVTDAPVWSITMNETVPTIGASSFGLGIGIRPTNSITADAQQSLCDFDMSNGASAGKLSIWGTSTVSPLAITSSALTLTAGDFITLTCRRDYNLVTAVVSDNTTSASLNTTYTYSLTSANTPTLPTSGQFGVFYFGGSVTMSKFSVTLNSPTTALLAFVGDSRTVGYDAGFTSAFSMQFANSEVFAANYLTTTDLLNEVPEVIAHHPQNVILTVGYNDLCVAGTAIGTVESNYQTIVNDLTSASPLINVYNLVIWTNSGCVNDATFRAWVASTYPSTTIDPQLQHYGAAAVLNADNVHLTSFGAQIVDYAIASFMQGVSGLNYFQYLAPAQKLPLQP